MPIRRVDIPEKHWDILEELRDPKGMGLLITKLAQAMKEKHEEFWQAIRAIIPELPDDDEDVTIHYSADHYVWWVE